MKHSHRHIRGALSVALIWAAVAAGCQSMRGGAKGSTAEQVFIPPPLSTSPNDVIQAGGIASAAAPAQLGSADSASPISTGQQFIPAQPQSMTPSASQSQWRPPSATTASSATAAQLREEPGCLPSEGDWRQQMEEQSAAVLKRLTQVEGELTSTRATLQSVNTSLHASQGKIEQLNQEVAHWKGEVQRLEDEMKSQQLADLKSLDELTETMHQVLVRQHAIPRSEGTGK